MSQTKNWQPKHQVKPEVKFEEELITITGIRNFRWKEEGQCGENYETRQYDLNNLTGAWFGLDPFSKSSWLAHTFLSFEFSKSDFLAVSIEARLKQKQSYNPILGVFGQYEIIYVVADELDLLGQRVGVWKNELFLYPLNLRTETVSSILIDMLERTNKLRKKTENYNSLWNNCITKLLAHANKFVDNPIKYGWKVLFPAFTDHLLYSHDLIKKEKTLKKTREKYRVSDHTPEEIYSEDFSLPFR